MGIQILDCREYKILLRQLTEHLELFRMVINRKIQMNSRNLVDTTCNKSYYPHLSNNHALYCNQFFSCLPLSQTDKHKV